MLSDKPLPTVSFYLTSCTDHLQSLYNLYQAILRHINEDPLRREILRDLLRMNAETVRLRLRKPHLWQLVELQQLADHYKLSSVPVRNAQSSLNSLGIWLITLSARERNRILKRCMLNRAVFQSRQRLGWGVEHIWSIQQGLDASIIRMAMVNKTAYVS